MTKRKKAKAKTKRKQKEVKPRFTGWLSSDDDEIARRRMRGREQAIRIDAVNPTVDYFGNYRARSDGGSAYQVEIRALAEHLNSCDCPDFTVNGLGTCKHIEATVNRLQRKGKRRFQTAANRGSPYIEIFLDRRDAKLKIVWPNNSSKRSTLRHMLSPFFSNDGSLLNDPLYAVPALKKIIAQAPNPIKSKVRVSAHLSKWLDHLRHHASRQRARKAFEADVADGKRSLDMVKVPLYDYQREGMLHLAFTGRAVLADEMGLGKTVQAIAACELLRRLHGIQRVLVISPASLKGEWEEQIAKFTELPSLIIQGSRTNRLRQYRQNAFFYLANYEQVRPDFNEMNQILAADVIILDEAQRIKNWQTKVAAAVKRLNSLHAFVLTGTPVENRIDEIYSIVQFLDPHVFGPLFRFNRNFYQLDERGRATGYKNLDKLHRRLRPIMLRRRKEEVEGELPDRTVNTFFVSMEPEQRDRYDEYKGKVAKLAAIANRRPLRKEEMEKMQMWLACMRMLCDSPYILDQDCRISPKLTELKHILQDLLAEGGHKIIIFSEWERMLQLVREQAEQMGLGYAWHTGSVSQPKRREEIKKFKTEPGCLLFLSTDSGSLGLNLQVADVVINLDLPWNPAKLEQRIARAWRKHQTRSVQVINLVCEDSIEQRMMKLLEQKRQLAQGVIDGDANISEMSLPSGRTALLERINNLVEQKPDNNKPESEPASNAIESMRDQVLAQWSQRLDLLQIHGNAGKQQTVFAVSDRVDDTLRASLEKTIAKSSNGATAPRLELVDRETFETISRLVEAGVLSLATDPANTLHRSPALSEQENDKHAMRLSIAQKKFDGADRKLKMANVLAQGSFAEEALKPLADAVEIGLQSLAYLHGGENLDPVPLGFVDSNLIKQGWIPNDTVALIKQLRTTQAQISNESAMALIKQGNLLLQQASLTLSNAALDGC